VLRHSALCALIGEKSLRQAAKEARNERPSLNNSRDRPVVKIRGTLMGKWGKKREIQRNKFDEFCED
jgi:hypothetical protein